ncbi:hypothetical protein C8R47DRAFT_1143969 [Mycena vitilis]|nr:hypothetical protein C8R47DRAFT_1143969 [Mycena vitilis]
MDYHTCATLAALPILLATASGKCLLFAKSMVAWNKCVQPSCSMMCGARVVSRSPLTFRKSHTQRLTLRISTVKDEPTSSAADRLAQSAETRETRKFRISGSHVDCG